MRGQQPGVSQPRLGFTDMQLLQQQYYSKQFQELQRQHQLQQLDQGTRPQNLQSQFSALTAQTAGDQLSSVVDGTPIRDASNYMWSSERVPQVGVDPKMLNSSQMFVLGNPGMARSGAPAIQGFPNGLGLQQENTHTLRAMGFIPQQLDQSMYGTSFSGIRDSSSNLTNPYSGVQWGAHGNADLFMKASGNQDQKTVIQSNAFGSFHGDQSAPFSGLVSGNDGIPASKHGYHGKNIFGRPQGMHSVNSGIHSGNFQQVASSPRNSQIQEFHRRVEHTGWSGNVEEKITPQVGPPQGVTSLDPLEEKILYGSDNNAWNDIRSGQPLPSAFGGPNSMNTEDFIQNNNQFDGSDYFNMLPSIQSGSWSALMQSAVAEASSSDTGMQDDWSGLSYQKAELSTGNHSDLNESGRQSTGWNEANAETPSSVTPRSFHLFDDVNMSTGGQSGREYQQIAPTPTYNRSGKVDGGIPCSRDFMHNDGPADSLGKSSNEGRWLEQIPQESSVADGSVQTPLVLGSASGSAWRTDAYNQSNKGAPENISSDLNIRSSWPHQQKPTLITRETDEQHVSKLNAWNMNESLPDGDNMQDDKNKLLESQKSESKGTVDIGTGCNIKLWEVGQLDGVQKNDSWGLSPFSNLNERFGQAKTSNGPQVHNAADACIHSFIPTPRPGMSNLHQERIQQMQNNHQFVQSLSSKKESENQSQHQQAFNSSLNRSDNASGETHESSRVMCYPTMGHDDGLAPDYLYHGQHARISSALKENTWSAKKDSPSSAAEMQKLPIQVVGRNSGLASSHGFLYHPTGELPVNFQQPSSMKRDLLYQGLQHGASGERKSLDLGYMSHTKPVSSAVNSEIGFMGRNLQNSRKGPGDAPASFDGPMAMYPSNDKYKTSQNMLELLNKVDQSTENAPKPFGSEEHGPSSAMSEVGKSNTATAYLQGNQLSSSQGFGLHLAPPSSAPAASKHFLTSDASLQFSTDLNSRHADMGNSDEGKIWLRTQISPQVLQHASDTSQQEYWAHKSGLTVMEQELSPIINRDVNSKLQSKHNVVAASGVHYLRNQLHRQDSSSVSGQAVIEESAHLVTAKQADQSRQDGSDSGFSQSEGPQGGCTGELSRRVLQPETTGKVVSFDLNPHAGTDFTGSSASSLLVRDGNGMNRQLSSSVSSPYMGNLRQLVHNSEQVPVSQVSGQQGMAQQRSFPALLQNAWSNMSAQRSMSGIAQKVSTSPLPSIGPPTTWVFQTVNDQNLSGRGGGSTCEPGPSSSSEHQPPSNELQQNRDGPPHQIPYDRAVPYGGGSSMETLEHNRHLAGFPLHNQNHVGDREAPESSLASKSTNISFQATSDSAARSQPNYSLLRQMQTMKNVENDPTKAIKKHKGEDDADVTHMTGKMGEKPVYSYANSGNTLTSVSQSPRGVEQSHRNCQMAMSWFEQFGTYKNGQFVTMSDRFAVPQNSAKPPVQQYFFGRVSESRPHLVEQKNVNDANQVGSASMQITTSLMPSKDHMFPFSSWPDTNDQSQAIVRHKKRKLATLELLPWDKVITRTSRKIQSISSVELRWAHATGRRVEKIDDEVEVIDDGLLMPGPRRRIIFTTQLMQQIICPLRVAMLFAEANKEYEAVTYILAKLLLGDACSLISSLAADSQAHTDQDSLTSKKPRVFRRLGNQFISKLVEGFLEKSRKQENDFLRLGKGPSLSDIRAECQDLERFSIINRFAKFHGRGPAEGAAPVEGAIPASAAVPSSVSSSYSDAVGVVPRKLFPHRYVTAVPMPRNLPEGMQCHSL